MADALLDILSDRNISHTLAKFAQEQQEIVKVYLKNYHRKLQLLDAFSTEWTHGQIQRLKEVMGELTILVSSEEERILNERKSIIQVLQELQRIVQKELDKRRGKTETIIYKKFSSFLRKLGILEKNVSLQQKWFQVNQSVLDKNIKKNELINLIRREGDVLFDINSTDLKDMIQQIHLLLEKYNFTALRARTAEDCEKELQGELIEFEKERAEFMIDEVSKLRGGFTNHVVLVKTNDKTEFVAKSFRPAGEFKLSMQARKFVTAAGGLVAPLIRVSQNEIICEKVKGRAILDILTADPTLALRACYTFGKSIATIHKNTLQELSFYNPRAIIRHKYILDYLNLKKRMEKFVTLGVLDQKKYAQFLKVRKKYYPDYLSIIVSDVNLTNYFYVDTIDSIIIVDYDYTKPGDPLADVGRMISAIRYQCFRLNFEQRFTEELVQAFLSGYKTILGIELRGVDLYNLIIYSIIINSAKPLIDKVKQLIAGNTVFAQNVSSVAVFFQGGYRDVQTYFTEKELNKARDVQYSLEQIDGFIIGERVIPALIELPKVA